MKKNTKRSLLMSVMALILCCAMLAGTTLAWFTDTASTAVNKIQAGTLDVQLLDEANNSLEGTTLSWQKATGHETEQVLWEPGCTYSLQSFKIKNNGTLALKYQVSITGIVGDTGLMNAIDFSYTVGNGDATALTSLNNFESSLAPNSETGLITITGHMKEDAGNEYKGLSIDGIGITVRATQLGGELDSVIGEYDSIDNVYDKDALYPPLATYINNTTGNSVTLDGEGKTDASAPLVITDNHAESTIPAGTAVYSDDGSTPVAVNDDGSLNRDIKTTNSTADSVTYDISYKYVAANGTSTDVVKFGKVVENVITVSTGLRDVKVTHTHGDTSTPMQMLDSIPATINDNTAYYDDVNGKIYIWSSEYSAFKVEYKSDFEAAVNGQGYATLAEAVRVANAASSDATVTLLKDVTLTADLPLSSGQRGVNLNLNGKTIDGGTYQVYTAGDGTINIFGGGTIKNTNATQNADYAPLRIYQYGSVVLDGVTVNGKYCAVKNSGNLTVKKANITGEAFGLGCFLNGTTVIGQLNGNDSDIVVTAKEQALGTAAATGYAAMNVTVYSGTFTSYGTEWDDCPAYWAGHGTLNVYGGTFKNTTSGTGAAALLQKNGTVNVFGGTFEAKDGIKLVAQSDSTEIVTAVQGGAFTGTRSGIYIDASNSTYMGRLSQYSVTIANGNTAPTFMGGTEGAIYAKTGGLGSKTLMTITGGKFSSDPSQYVGNGKCVTINGNYYEVSDSLSATTILVNPSNIQDFLDGKYGSIDGKTLVLGAGTYGKLELGRATKYAGSNTDYYIGGVSAENKKTYDEFVTIKNSGTWSASAYYVRNMNNVTLKAAEGAAVTVAGMTGTAGHVYGESYDYVLDKAYASGSAYFLTQNWQNITMEGITFTAKVDISSSLGTTVIDGVTFKNCTFNIGNTTSGNQALRYYNENNDGGVRNLTVEDCEFNNCYQGVYTNQINGITVKDSRFNTTDHNAIAVQSSTHGAVNHKAVVITGNTFTNIGDRIIRFGAVGADTQITIQNNTATNSGDSAGEVIKAQSLAEGVTYNISGNNWGEGKTIHNSELADA